MKLKGTIRRSDLEGGLWTLDADGETYQLVGDTKGAKDGMKAVVEGKIEKGAMGIGMVGKQFAVTKISAA